MATNNSSEKNFVEKCSDFLDKFYNLPRKYYVLLVFLFPLISPKRFSFLWKEHFINVFLKDFGVGMDKKPIQNLDYVFIVFYIAIFLIVIGLFLYKKIKHNYIFSLFYQLILFGIGSVYLIYRSGIFFTNPFFPLKLADCHFFIFTYSDIVLLTLIIPIIYFGSKTIQWFKAKDVKPIVKQEGEPISHEIQGFVHDFPTPKGESKLAQTVIEKLLHTKSEETAFSLGISGEWGTGKTSFLMLLEEELKKQAKAKQKNVVIIKFNPWNSTSPQAIITDFFDTFRSELGKHSAEIKHSLNDYSQKLVNTDGDIFSILKFIGNLFGEDKSIMQEHEKINEILKKINRQVFIFIDDLDRLDKNEVIEVIRLIRNSANFYNVFFIVAYDKGYVEEAIEQLSTHNKSFFLEKIFQLELHLPAYEYHHIADDLYEKLIVTIPFLKNDVMVAKFIKNHNIIRSNIQNYRDVKRFINSFSSVYLQDVTDDTFFPDIFLIELLRLKYSLVYDLLKKEPSKLLDTDTENSQYSLKQDKLKPIFGTKYNDLNLDKINDILSVLFNSTDYLENYHSSTKRKRIKNIYDFHTYYAYRTLDDNITDNDLLNALNNLEKLKLLIDKWNTRNIFWQFIKKSKTLNNSLKDDKKKVLIEGIIYFGNKRAEKFCLENEHLFNLYSDSFSYSNLQVKFNEETQYFAYKDWDNLLKLNKNQDLSNLFIANKTSNPNIFGAYLLSITRIILIQDSKKLEILPMYIEELCKKETNSEEEAIQLMFFVIQIFYYTINTNLHIVKPTIISFLKKERNFVRFLCYLIYSDNNGYNINSQLIISIFGTIKEFEQEIDELLESNNLYLQELNEFKEFLAICKNASFRGSYPFKSEYLKVHP